MYACVGGSEIDFYLSKFRKFQVLVRLVLDFIRFLHSFWYLISLLNFTCGRKFNFFQLTNSLCSTDYTSSTGSRITHLRQVLARVTSSQCTHENHVHLTRRMKKRLLSKKGYFFSPKTRPNKRKQNN